MIQVAGVWFSAQRTTVALLGSYLIYPFARHSVLPKPVRLLARGVLACPAPTRQSRWTSRVRSEVHQRQGLLAAWTPVEALGNPGVVPHRQSQGASTLSV